MEVKWYILVVATLAPYTLAVYRPCRFDDLDCIGTILEARSGCNRSVPGPSKELYFKDYRFSTPYFNCSYVEKDLVVKNTDDCFVSEFFINPATDRAVLGVDCPNKQHEANRTMIQYISLREPKTFSYHFKALYPLVRLTIVMPSARTMDLCAAHTLAEVLALPQLLVSPNDRPTAKFLTRDLTMLNVFETENFYCRSSALARLFVQSALCDYGCPVKSICE